MLTKRDVLAKATRIGLDGVLLDAYNTVTKREYDFGDVDEKIREFELLPEDRKGAILFPVTQGYNRNAYCILAHAFRVRGYEPIVPLCYNDLPVCIFKGARYSEDDLASCAQCHHFGTALLEQFGIEPIYIDDILPSSYEPPDIPPGEDLETIEYRGVDVGTYALASTRQFFMRRTVDETAYQRDVHRRFIKSAVKLVDLANLLFDTYDFNACVGFHDVYIYAGIYSAVAEQRDIPAVSVSRGYYDQTLLFGNQANNVSLPHFTNREYVEAELKQPLEDTERTEIDEYIASRKDGNASRFNLLNHTSEEIEVTGTRPFIGMYTNLIWDASLEGDGGLFASPYSWIRQTIEFMTDIDNIEFIIKVHPAEAVRGTNESVHEWICDNYTPLPENVSLLPPDTDVSPYEMIEASDATLVFNSTVGLESAYYRVPVIVAGETHYQGFGFTHDPEDLDSYRELLRDARSLKITETMHERARRYAHLLFIRKHIDFPFYTSKPAGGVNRLPVSHDDVTPGNENFDLIVQKILNEEPVVLPKS